MQTGVAVKPEPVEVMRPRRSRFGAAGGLAASMVRDPNALSGVLLLAFFTIVALAAPLIAPYGPSVMQFQPMAAPSVQNLLGTTNTGQDIF